MGRKFVDLTGKVFGVYTALNISEYRGNATLRKPKGAVYWDCFCSVCKKVFPKLIHNLSDNCKCVHKLYKWELDPREIFSLRLTILLHLKKYGVSSTKDFQKKIFHPRVAASVTDRTYTRHFLDVMLKDGLLKKVGTYKEESGQYNILWDRVVKEGPVNVIHTSSQRENSEQVLLRQMPALQNHNHGIQQDSCASI
jgi:hypothetical protein